MSARSITAALILNASQFKKGLEDARKEALKFQSSMKSVGRDLSLAVSAPLALAAKSAIDAAVNFDLIQAKIGGLSGRAGQIKLLSDEAKRLGAETIFTATQVGELQLNLKKLGLTSVTIAELTPVVIKFAQALDQDLATAGEFLVTLLNKMPDSFDQFSNKTDRATYAAEGIAYAVANSALTVEGLQNSLNYVGAEADAAGLSFDKTVAILGALANAGYTGSRAGTQLRRILVELTGTADTTEGAFDQFIDKGLTFEEVINQVGIRAAGMGAALQGQGPAIAAFAEGIRTSAGNLDIFSAALENTLFAKFAEVESAFEALGIAIVEGVTPALKSVLEVIARVGRGMATLPKPFLAVIAVIVTLGVVIPPLILAMASLKSALLQLSIAGGTLTAAFTVWLPIIAAASAAIAIFSGYAAGASSNMAGLSGTLEGVLEEMKLLQEQEKWADIFESSIKPIENTKAKINLLKQELEKLYKTSEELAEDNSIFDVFEKGRVRDAIVDTTFSIRTLTSQLEELQAISNLAFYRMAADAAIANEQLKANPITISKLKDEYDSLYQSVLQARRNAAKGGVLNPDAIQKSIDRMNELRTMLALYGVEVKGLDKKGENLEKKLGTGEVQALSKEYERVITAIRALQQEGSKSPVSLDKIKELEGVLADLSSRLALLGVELKDVFGSDEYNAEIDRQKLAVEEFIKSINAEADQLSLTDSQLLKKRFDELTKQYEGNTNALLAIYNWYYKARLKLDEDYNAEQDRLDAEANEINQRRLDELDQQYKALYDSIYGYALNFTTALTQSINDVVSGTKTLGQALKENLIGALNKVLAKVLALIATFVVLNILSGGMFAGSGIAVNAAGALGGRTLGQFVAGGLMPSLKSSRQNVLKVEGFVSGSNLVIANRRGTTAIDRIYG
jgi:hypothetical protein